MLLWNDAARDARDRRPFQVWQPVRPEAATKLTDCRLLFILPRIGAAAGALLRTFPPSYSTSRMGRARGVSRL